MSVNNANLTLSAEQSATLLNSIVQQATGQSVLAQINTGDYTSIATTALRNGYDPVLNAISQVLSRTVYAIRPYRAKLKALRVTEQQWGGMTRKINFVDRPVVDDERITPMVDGEEYSPWKVRKPKVLETHIYGFNQYEDYVTIFRDQLDTAFTGADQFRTFIGGVIQNMLDKLEQYRENESRACLVNLIGSTVACENNNGARGRVRHLLTEYAAFTGAGATPTVASIFASNETLRPFATWLAGEMATTSRKFAERTTLYHEVPYDGAERMALMRHTDPADTICYMLSEFFDKIDAMVRPGIFDNGYLKYVDYEGVTFWQDIETPAQIDASVSYLKVAANTDPETADAEIELPYVLGVWFDRDAAGIRLMSEWNQNTGMNARKGFATEWYHFRDQWMNDNTENCIVWLLD